MTDEQREALRYHVSLLSKEAPASPTLDALSAEEIERINHCVSDDEWNAMCTAVKKARGGTYPSDWFAKVMLSGLADRVQSRWRK